ncbi:hypothetical protein B0H13DRAFT_2021163 [Mycena leptocephala]|nr:hypothetical protein B0H13DRAFT_2021163 [Mycena leptocephala]
MKLSLQKHSKLICLCCWSLIYKSFSFCDNNLSVSSEMPESRKESVYFAKQAERTKHMNLVASSDQAAVVEVNAEKDLLLDNPINTSIGEDELSNDICDLLIKHGYDPIGSLLDVKESELKSLGFKIGHNAELRWALKKMMLAKFGTVPIRNEEGKYKPILIGGTGGDGGPGGYRGGQGGVGRSHRIGGAGGIDIKDLFRFTGFRGGSGGVIYEGVGTNGIPGSHGKAVRMFIWQVSFFEEIMGKPTVLFK